MSDEPTQNKLARLHILSRGFGFRRITDSLGRQYFAHNGAIYATGYDFTERDNKTRIGGSRCLPRPHVSGLPTGFDLICYVDRRWFIDNSFEYYYSQTADDAPFERVSDVYEAAFGALPRWRKAIVLFRALIP